MAEKNKMHNENKTHTDIVSKEKRSEMMSKVRSKDSSAEKKVRTALHNVGYRFRLHKKDLPGTPDIVLPKYRLAIFINGCFWHRHQGCTRGASTPKTNLVFWEKKFTENVDRDAKAKLALEALGWQVIVVWECKIRKNNQCDIVSSIVVKRD